MLDLAGARQRREGLGERDRDAYTGRFDRFWFFLTLALGAGGMALALMHQRVGASDRETAMLAGVGLVWFLDLLRNLTAVLLAMRSGFPLYGSSSAVGSVR